MMQRVFGIFVVVALLVLTCNGAQTVMKRQLHRAQVLERHSETAMDFHKYLEVIFDQWAQTSRAAQDTNSIEAQTILYLVPLYLSRMGMEVSDLPVPADKRKGVGANVRTIFWKLWRRLEYDGEPLRACERTNPLFSSPICRVPEYIAANGAEATNLGIRRYNPQNPLYMRDGLVDKLKEELCKDRVYCGLAEGRSAADEKTREARNVAAQEEMKSRIAKSIDEYHARLEEAASSLTQNGWIEAARAQDLIDKAEAGEDIDDDDLVVATPLPSERKERPSIKQQAINAFVGLLNEVREKRRHEGKSD